MPIRFDICSAHELPEHLPEATHLVSIWSPGLRKELPQFKLPEAHILRVDFDDIEQTEGSQPLAGSPMVPPSSDDIKRIIAFGKGLPPEAKLLIHCQAGISRSAAAAYSILCAREPEVSAKRHLVQIWRQRWKCWPNKLVVEYADDLLHRKGEMLIALDWFRALQQKRLHEWAARTFEKSG